MSVVGSSTHAATAPAVSSLAHVSWSGVGSPWSSCGAATRVTVVLSTVAATVWAIVPPGWLTVTAMPSITAAVRTILVVTVPAIHGTSHRNPYELLRLATPRRRSYKARSEPRPDKRGPAAVRAVSFACSG